MATIGRTYVGPQRNYATACDVCGVTWHRSDLELNANGLFVCPDDVEGRVEAELDRANGQGLSTGRISRGGPRK